jgi:hypothetical protein
VELVRLVSEILVNQLDTQSSYTPILRTEGHADSSAVTSRPANAAFYLNQLTMWENSKSLNDPKIAKWVNEKLLPELEQNKKLKPLVVWQNKQDKKNYVIDGNHRFLAYQAANWKDKIPVIVVPDNEVLVTDWTPQSGKPQPV